jgi:hypothetical protein
MKPLKGLGNGYQEKPPTTPTGHQVNRTGETMLGLTTAMVSGMTHPTPPTIEA